MHRELVECCPHMPIGKDVYPIANGSAVDFKFGRVIIRWFGDGYALTALIELVADAIPHR